MTLTLDEVVDLMLEGSAMTDPCEGSYYSAVTKRTCAIGAAAYAYLVKHSMSVTQTNIMDVVDKIEKALQESGGPVLPSKITEVSDSISRDAAIAFVKDKL